MQNTARKITFQELPQAEQEFLKAKRLAEIREKSPNGFRRYRVKNYERGEFRAK